MIQLSFLSIEWLFFNKLIWELTQKRIKIRKKFLRKIYRKNNTEANLVKLRKNSILKLIKLIILKKIYSENLIAKIKYNYDHF